MSIEYNIADIRKEYKLKSFLESEALLNPIDQFAKWWDEAATSKIEEYNAMTICTCSLSGKPSARIVLLKGFSEEGFIFYTNYNSRKGREILENPDVAIVFFWKELERQIRIEGKAMKTNEMISDAYFDSRPLGSKIGALSSPQSTIIPSRDYLEVKQKEIANLYSNKGIKRPDHWGGFIIKPELFEFWQGRPSRLHDRIEYVPAENNSWSRRRLAP